MSRAGSGSAINPPPSLFPQDATVKVQIDPKLPPQERLNRFWKSFTQKSPGKVHRVLPESPHSKKLATGSAAAKKPSSAAPRSSSAQAGKSYEQARQECIRSVERIVRECKRTNQKYTDPYFDIELDLKTGRRDFLDGLGQDVDDNNFRPRGVKRVADIFEKPQFFINGPTAGDVRQGAAGDCWFLAALCTLSDELINRICVARNEQVGVYGFVFYRDGEWQQCIIDDKLYLRAADYDESVEERPLWDDLARRNAEEEYRKAWQTGSRALYFAQCADENETWLPLLEKAFAKAHGDYSAIEGGFVGEAVEDLTGGVTTEILSSNILDKDKFWEELLKSNKEFLFGCSTGIYADWLGPFLNRPKERKGIIEGHAYSIMEAREVNGVRLLKVRNPWGQTEWKGPWSDGSEQWTPEWMQILGHKFGNDGVFWISYEDLLKKYQHFDRTRLFGPDWTVTQQWTSVSVPWSSEYLDTLFEIELTKAGQVIIVLTQLDDRYFQGLQGEYSFRLQFRLEKEGKEEYIVRNTPTYMMRRSVSTDIELEPGKYLVRVKIIAYRHGPRSTEEAVQDYATSRREKLIQIGRSYDLAHAKVPDLAAKKQNGIQRRATEETEKSEKAPTVVKEAHEQKKNGADIKCKGKGKSEETEENEWETGGETDDEEADGDDDNQSSDEDASQPPSDDGSESEASNNNESEQLWNAVCVVGLKVYSKDSELSLRVVKPVEEAELDRDDPALFVSE